MVLSELLGIVLVTREEFWLGIISVLAQSSSITCPYRGRQIFLPCISSQLTEYFLQ